MAAPSSRGDATYDLAINRKRSAEKLLFTAGRIFVIGPPSHCCQSHEARPGRWGANRCTGTRREGNYAQSGVVGGSGSRQSAVGSWQEFVDCLLLTAYCLLP